MVLSVTNQDRRNSLLGFSPVRGRDRTWDSSGPGNGLGEYARAKGNGGGKSRAYLRWFIGAQKATQRVKRELVVYLLALSLIRQGGRICGRHPRREPRNLADLYSLDLRTHARLCQ